MLTAGRRDDNRETGTCQGRSGFVALIAIVTLLTLSATSASAQPVPTSDTLFLAQFDRSCDADFAFGSPAAVAQAPLGPGRLGSAAELSSGNRVVYVGDDGNFVPAQGTIDFWVKPHWPGNDEGKHSLFTCRFGTQGYININTVGNNRLGIALSGGQGDTWRWRRAEGEITAWKPDQWHHVAFAWGDGHLQVWLDGREGRRSVDDARMPDQMPATLELVGADAAIDAFRISQRRFTESDVQRAIQQAQQPPGYRYLDDLVGADSHRGRQLLGGIRIPLMLAGLRYSKGIALRENESVDIDLNGDYDRFLAVVGLDDFTLTGTSCSFQVLGDGRRLFQSPLRTRKQPPLPIEVTITGVKRLRLTASLDGAASGTGRAVWANAAVTRRNVAAVFPPAKVVKTTEVYRRQVDADRFTFTLPGDGLCVVVPKFWEDELDPARQPALDQIGHPITAQVTPGELEPVNFVVYAGESFDDVRISVSDLRNGDATIAANQVDVRLVLRGLMRDIYTLPPERSTVVSRFLLHDRPIAMPKGTLREYHLIVHVPQNAAAGKYSGKATLTAAGGLVREVPIELDVLPFHLRPLTRKAYGVYYRFRSNDEDDRQTHRELTDIRAHGATMLKAPLGVQYERDGNEVVVSYDRLRHGLELLRQHGFQGPLPVSTGCEQAARLLGYDPVADHDKPAARERFHGIIRRAMQGLAGLSHDYPEFELLPTHMDEVFGRDRLERYIRLTEAVRQVPSLRVYITMHNNPRSDVTAMMQRCDPFVDVRCYNGHAMDEWIRAGHFFDELRQQLDRSGDEAWTYYNIRGSFFKAEWTRLVNGFYLWISPLRVHVPWMYYSYNGNPLDDTDGPHLRGHDFAYAAPDPEDPDRLVSTRHWEAYREGIDDMRYLATLEELIGERGPSPAAREAQRWLDTLRARLRPDPEKLQTIEGESPILQLWSNDFDGPDYRQFRREAASLIERLGAEDH